MHESGSVQFRKSERAAVEKKPCTKIARCRDVEMQETTLSSPAWTPIAGEIQELTDLGPYPRPEPIGTTAARAKVDDVSAQGPLRHDSCNCKSYQSDMSISRTAVDFFY